MTKYLNNCAQYRYIAVSGTLVYLCASTVVSDEWVTMMSYLWSKIFFSKSCQIANECSPSDLPEFSPDPFISLRPDSASAQARGHWRAMAQVLSILCLATKSAPCHSATLDACLLC